MGSRFPEGCYTAGTQMDEWECRSAGPGSFPSRVERRSPPSCNDGMRAASPSRSLRSGWPGSCGTPFLTSHRWLPPIPEMPSSSISGSGWGGLSGADGYGTGLLEGVLALEGALQGVTWFIRVHTGLPTAKHRVLGPMDHALSDARWDVCAEDGHWISTPWLVWMTWGYRLMQVCRRFQLSVLSVSLHNLKFSIGKDHHSGHLRGFPSRKCH